MSIFIIISACNTVENDSEIETIVKTYRIYPSLHPLVTDSEYAIVNSLFSKNNLSLSNLKVYRLQENKGYHVRCYQFYNSLELFTNDVVFNFDANNNYTSLGGKLINSIDIGFLPKVLMQEASNLFYKEINSDWYQKDSLDSYYNYGFNAELGIFDLNYGHSNAQENFVLAWRLTINNKSDYPKAYFRADLLELIYYSNGVIIN
ncbi:MAG: hypothetical protein ACYDEX_26135 [Mobilitalea sp.]